MAQRDGNLVDGPYRKDARVNYYLAPGEVLMPCPYEVSHFVLPQKLPAHLTKCRHNYLTSVHSGKKKLMPGEEMVVCPYTYLHHVPAATLEAHKKICDKNADNEISRDIKAAIADQLSCKNMEGQDEFKKYYPGKQETPARTHVFPGERGDPGAGPYGANATGGPAFGPKGVKEELPKKHSGRKSADEKFVAAGKPLLVPKVENPADEDWELDLKENPEGNSRYTYYNPQAYVAKNIGKIITNPQGLTKSERKEHRARVVEHMLLENREDEYLQQEAKKAYDGGTTPYTTDVDVAGRPKFVNPFFRQEASGSRAVQVKMEPIGEVTIKSEPR